MKKKVLIIAYYWPPAGGPGVQRWLKFVKYLPYFEIEPIVYVPENPSYPIVDNSLLAEVPEGVTILKQPIKEPYGWANALSRKQTKTISSGILPKEKKQSLLQKLLLYIRGNFFIPDARKGWIKPSVSYLKAYIKENAIETIITTGPPHSLHLIGKELKQWKSDLRWFTDFRDPWTTIGYHDKLRMTTKTKAKHKQLEREVLNEADHIIVTSPGTKREFTEITDKPITVITNGYDDRELGTPTPIQHFTLAHIGSLLSDRCPEMLWQVLQELCEENADFKNAFKLVLVGKVSAEVIERIQHHGLEEYLDFKGYVSHKEALQIQETATALLLIEIDDVKTKGIIAGKIFEYLSAKRPILAIGPEGADIKDIIEGSQSGIFTTYSDHDRIKNWIRTLFENKGQLRIRANNIEIEKYHRKNLTASLAQLLKK